MHFTRRSGERGGAALLFLLTILLGFLAIAAGLSDDVNRRMRFALADEQTAYVKELAERLRANYDNQLRSRGNTGYASLPLVVLDNPGSITGSQLLTALGEINPKYNLRAWVSDLLTFSPCNDSASCTGVSGQLTGRRIVLWIPPESGVDTSGPNASGHWVADPNVIIWEVTDGQILQSSIFGDTLHTYDRLVQWLQQFYASRQLMAGSVSSNNPYQTSDCGSVSSSGLPCLNTPTTATAAVLAATGLSASDLVDAWGYPIQVSNPAGTVNLSSTQTQSTGLAFSVSRQVGTP
jgi:hypothetical protein